MNDELKSLLEENLRVSKETNELLKSMRRQAWWGFLFRTAGFVLLVVLPLLFLPYFIGKFMDTIGQELGSDGSSGFDMDGLQKLIDQYKVE